MFVTRRCWRAACDGPLLRAQAFLPVPARRRAWRQHRYGWAVAASIAAVVAGFGGVYGAAEHRPRATI